jgi:hypothetical protein
MRYDEAEKEIRGVITPYLHDLCTATNGLDGLKSRLFQ